MSNFRKYQHIERFGTTEVEGIEHGKCYIMPKLDGTSGSMWMDENGKICGGSRKRELGENKDNANFYKTITQDERYTNFLKDHPDLRLYGEFLVPHSLKTYRDDAWRKFYVFDVVQVNDDRENEGNTFYHMSYDDYLPLMEEYNLDYVPVQAIIINPTESQLLNELQKNNFLIKDGAGIGEGIVIKNYQFVNRYGRQTWAKIVTNEFKNEIHRKEMGPSVYQGTDTIESMILDTYCTEALIDKTYAKIEVEKEGWSSRFIPMLLSLVYHEIIVEEMWHIVKKYKNPTINFRNLNSLIVNKIKLYRKDLF